MGPYIRLFLVSSGRDKDEAELMMREYHRRHVKAPISRVYLEFASLGGDRGWPSMNWAWQLRGLLDRLVGGSGMRRGRRHPTELEVGEVLDFWRVEEAEPGRHLKLRAEMKMPGSGWLEFRAEPDGEASSWLEQTASFDPHGFWGSAYWYALFPFHSWIFRRMIRKLARRAERAAS
jgi:hypothetical protein